MSSDAVLRLFADGSTVVLQGLHRLWPPLIEFADQLAADLGHPTQVNAYITPPSSRGFSPHYDVHDVFVLQVAGEKHWTIHEPVLRDPLRTQPWNDRAAEVAAAAEREPVIDAVLRPGDVALPAARLPALGHRARGDQRAPDHRRPLRSPAGAPPSRRWTWCGRWPPPIPTLRGSLPLGVDLGDPASVRDDVAAVIAGLQDWLGRLDPAEVADRLRAQTWAQVRPEPVAPLAQSAAAAALTADTVLRLRRRLRCSLRDDDRRPPHPPGRAALALLPRATSARHCGRCSPPASSRSATCPGWTPPTGRRWPGG